jgi:hypothetical protein
MIMRRVVAAWCFVLLLAMSSFGGHASGSAFVGSYTPVIQSNANNGIAFGICSRIKIFETIYAEPFFLYIQENSEKVLPGDRSTARRGTSISSIGGNLNIGTQLAESVRPYASAGIGLAMVDLHEGRDRSKRFCSNWGTGIEYILIRSRLFLDLNAHLFVIYWEDRTYLNSILINCGLNWYFKWED